jgi:hypothetical protein
MDKSRNDSDNACVIINDYWLIIEQDFFKECCFLVRQNYPLLHYFYWARMCIMVFIKAHQRILLLLLLLLVVVVVLIGLRAVKFAR